MPRKVSDNRRHELERDVRGNLVSPARTASTTRPASCPGIITAALERRQLLFHARDYTSVIREVAPAHRSIGAKALETVAIAAVVE